MSFMFIEPNFKGKAHIKKSSTQTHNKRKMQWSEKPSEQTALSVQKKLQKYNTIRDDNPVKFPP